MHRERCIILAFRCEEDANRFRWPVYVAPLQLEDLLCPRQHEQCDPTRRPKALVSAQQVGRAAAKAQEQQWPPNRDWVLADHMSTRFKPNPQPGRCAPTIRHGHTAGSWLGSRGRRFTFSESARLMGYSSEQVVWTQGETTNWRLLGNTIAQPMMERLLTAIPPS